MTKHTPGPWTMREKEKCGVIDLDRWIIECETNVPGHKNQVATAGYKPYARLIAAAPDLLEACKLALQEFNEMGYEPPKYKIDLLKQAIAKAE